MRELRRITENCTADIWKQILAALKREASKRKLAIDKVTLTGFDVTDRKDPSLAFHFNLELMNTGAGEVIVSANGRKWNMGDTFIRDRSGMSANGMKRPDMDSQVKNIMDMAQAMIDKKRNK